MNPSHAVYLPSCSFVRRDSDGRFVPLAKQDAKLWSREMIIEADGYLISATRFMRFGRYQCEAAIQSVQAQRPMTGTTNYAALRTLYDLLLTHVPSIGAAVGRAAVIAEAGDAINALKALEDIPADCTLTYQPYWVTLARVLASLKRTAEAQHALDMAIGLTEDDAVRSYLRGNAASPQ